MHLILGSLSLVLLCGVTVLSSCSASRGNPSLQTKIPLGLDPDAGDNSLKLSRWQRQVRPQRRGCLRRSCDQTVTGRNLSYRRALRSVQNEEYLSAVDRGVIRRHLQRRKRQGGVIGVYSVTKTTDFSLAGPLALTAILAASAVVLLAQPGVQPVLQGQAPPGLPQPGTPGGGGLPIPQSPSSALALSLVPPGLVPVAVFPPYATPRTLPAVSVIFSEGTGTCLNGRKKRNLASVRHFMYSLQGQRLRNIQQIAAVAAIDLLKARLQVKLRTLKNNLRCLNVRLARGLGIILRDYPGTRDQTGQLSFFDDEDNEVPTWDQCFDDIPQPLYGFRSLISLVDNELCIEDQTCDSQGNRLRSPGSVDFSSRNFTSRQTGEVFRSDAPPNCRAVRVADNSC